MFMPAVFHENLFDDLFDPFWNEGALERAMVHLAFLIAVLSVSPMRFLAQRC